ncbi:MAG TPA: hypothetical protein VMG98_08815 [Verrucomicrobiae bacterium]|nr:hypothetical protein [Verrucomicrobiae bacterium]
MNIKRLAALVTLGALLSTAAPALAVTATGTVNVEWNYAITATITMYTQTTASQTHTVPAANDVYWASDPAGGNSGCEGTVATASAGKDPGAAGTVNFGNVVADSTDYGNCLETNAVDAYVVTNDSLGANVTVAVSGNPTMPTDYDTAGNGGSLLCLLPNGTWSTTGNTAWTASARVAAVSMNSTTACSSGTALTTTAANVLALTKATTGSDLNADLQLNMAPQMVSGQQNVTLTYTLTSN